MRGVDEDFKGQQEQGGDMDMDMDFNLVMYDPDPDVRQGGQGNSHCHDQVLWEISSDVGPLSRGP
ncbi:hypothetical protein PAXRUDRAFT_16312 [Paxillus rubicundulus Ve08.2h10]|uniref:Unplaced genomic scaffold scaffold_1450, whole genome shotgun sequence n=1 Tax=Paxillus rubicundulus Ve08.2h10 TaxID=930991 RepID=A0A0D0DM76_9AGAM|nr:hypothetical protein PAXRUDRAFT_16312 [Paxillus rubicundulus Ve08.2h10]